MKNLLHSVVIFTTALLFFGCNPDESPEQSFEGTWELVEIRSQWTRDVLTGEDMYIRESYTFHPNGTFSKSRVGTELDYNGSGTYIISVPDPIVEGNENLRTIVDLIFNNNVSSDLVYGCNIWPRDTSDNDEELTEQMYLSDDGFLRNWGCQLVADLNWYVYSKN